MKVLLVQPYGDNGQYDLDEVHFEVKSIIETCGEQVDLIVFPEAFEFVEDVQQESWRMVADIANFYGIPVVVGTSTAEGTEEAYYYHPNPKPGDSESKVYVKHSTSPRVCFDYNFDQHTEELIYKPLLLNGHKIQICICHDMFYPLLIERLEREGMDILINLTGGNVTMSKWNTLLRGRSMELSGPVICTMGNRTSMKQKSDRIVYDAGERLVPISEYGNGKTGHAYSIFDLQTEECFIEKESFYSKNEYDAFTIGSETCDISLQLGKIETSLPIIESFENSYRVKKKEDIIHVHVANEDDLFDRTYVFKQPRREKDHYVFIYFCEDLDYSTAITMARMRAIENRIAVVIVTPTYKIGAKTNRYKDVQVFRSNTIGFDLEHMYGFDSVYEKNAKSSNGLNVVFKEKYEGLIQSNAASKELCLKRDFPILLTPEETVRQALLKDILQVVPKENVEVEFLLQKIADTDNKLRADILVFDEGNKPFVIIECKEQTAAITLSVKEQVENYNCFIQAPYIAMTNGNETEIYEQTPDGYQLLSLTSITDLLKRISYTYIEKQRMKRRSYEENTTSFAINELIANGNLSPVSTDQNKRFYGELWNALLAEPFERTEKFPLIEQIEDLGYGYYGFQNGSGKGGRFNFDYRSFKVKIDGETFIYRLTIAAAGTTSNDKVYGNRKGSTGLCVGIQKKAHNAHVLELNLDTFTKFQQNNVIVFHNGKGLQKYGIMSILKDELPQFLKNDEIILGEFKKGESIATSAFSYLVEAIICYCHVRSKLKEAVKRGER